MTVSRTNLTLYSLFVAEILGSKKTSQKQRAYRLFAVVYHDGKEASKGHYITDVFHTGYNSWLRYDDSSVKPIGEKQVLQPHTPRVPYLLYYRRSDTLPPVQASNGGGAGATVGVNNAHASSSATSTTSTGNSTNKWMKQTFSKNIRRTKL